MTETERVLSMGGKVGSKFVGTDEDGTDVVEIIALNVQPFGRILAKCVEKNGKPHDGHEANWTLSMREWTLLG